MKIALFTEASAAGVGRHVMDLAEGLITFGHEVHVLYGMGRVDRTFAERVAQLPHSCAFDMATNPHPSDFRVVQQTRQYFRLHGPFDILHAHSTKAGLLMRLAAFHLPGAVLYTPHAPLTMNPRFALPLRGMLAFFELILSGITDRVIAVSEEEAVHLAHFLLSRRKITVVANGIAQSCSTGGERHPDRHDLRIGFLGRLSKQKNAGMLLEAFASAFGRSPKITLTIAGSGPEERTLRAKACVLGIADRVNWIRFCTSATIADFDIFALPSSYEGMPYVLLEALSFGVPVVATAVGGVRSVICDRAEGFVVPPGDMEQFAAALRHLAFNPSLRRQMSQAARIAAAQFTLSRMLSETLHVYQQTTRKLEPKRALRTLPVTAD